jgi:hypothetical protein
VFVRKAVLTIAGTLIDEPASAAGTLAVVLLTATFLQASLHPYEDPAFNTSEVGALWAATAVAMLAALLDGRPDDPGSAALVALVVVVAAIAFLFLLWRFLRHLRGSATAGAVRKAVTSLRGLSVHMSVRMPSLRGVAEPHPATVRSLARGERRDAVPSVRSDCVRGMPETSWGLANVEVKHAVQLRNLPAPLPAESLTMKPRLTIAK